MRSVAVLTISDSAHAGTRQDLSGPALRERLEQAGFRVTEVEVLPDDRAAIAFRLRALAGTGAVSAIFTTGGTGVSRRDVTPEATRDVIDKEIPGMAETMRARGRESTPLAVLSRAVVGTCGAVLIVNLPGSPRGAVESLDAILELVPHVLDLLCGHTEHGPHPERFTTRLRQE